MLVVSGISHNQELSFLEAKSKSYGPCKAASGCEMYLFILL
jgi:hypothetical protein